MAAIALLIYLLALGLAFGWRSLAQWRRTGDTGLRLDAGPAGTLRWWAKLLFVAALLLGTAGPVAALAGMNPVGTLDRPAMRIIGLVLAIAGVIATLSAQTGMGTSWRVGVDPGERTDLVTGGPFALARNPIFTAMIVTSLGLALMVPNPISLAATVVLVVSIQVQVRAVEEPYLARMHGAAYASYASQVGRFLPGIGRLTKPAEVAGRR
ncbi:Protein-S-isoprenylcysteine O-methyltransferase Ste14 [Micromonospora viridifaciens]|uniref:Protein-S-isoprenylcysteine O-methyltransferase Ste14 n=1 Tax=Micromonospora viridifaciens TaxID=1881 RepID=A0A1C4WM89_MICVI|nr:isoprenylcysteine carboxylmethyltransferase family protein [Micromonospora viridifaciens]SCE97294.1 Protein-S-isoprenylcysteine O-methyltransferase Ste14 [Micromonospora viridifaciens]